VPPNPTPMLSAPLPPNEAGRLAALRSYQILDTKPERAYDELVKLAGAICGVPISLVSFVDEGRQWFKAKLGIDGDETPRDVAFCSHAILRDELFIVDDAGSDPRFADNPFVCGAPFVRFYAGAPLRARGGERLGTLCVVDHIPRRLTDGQREALNALKNQAEAHLELRLRAAELAAAERRERAARTELEAVQRQKDELLQYLVHDLKSPISAVLMNGRLLRECVRPDRDVVEAAADVVEAGERLTRLTHDMLDVGRGTTKGLRLRREAFDPAGLAADVASALRRQSEVRGVRVALDFDPELGRLSGDREVLRRVLINLVDNALRSSPRGGVVTVAGAHAGEGRVRLEVRDRGAGVPEAARAAIFDAYVTSDLPGAGRGHGLGLAFCRLAAAAHGGSISYERRAECESVFAVELPAQG
jgi:signal transduction histidine kinase